jgi:hypothetical protein
VVAMESPVSVSFPLSSPGSPPRCLPVVTRCFLSLLTLDLSRRATSPQRDRDSFGTVRCIWSLEKDLLNTSSRLRLFSLETALREGERFRRTGLVIVEEWMLTESRNVAASQLLHATPLWALSCPRD